MRKLYKIYCIGIGLCWLVLMQKGFSTAVDTALDISTNIDIHELHFTGPNYETNLNAMRFRSNHLDCRLRYDILPCDE